MTAPEKIWASFDIGMLGSTGRWVTQGTENPFDRIEYTRAATIPDPLDDPRVKALVSAASKACEELAFGSVDEAMKIVSGPLFEALSTLTKDQQE